MTDPEFDPEACAAAVAADPALQAAADEVRSDPDQMSEHLAGHVPIAVRRAALESTIATASPIVAERLRTVLLHPAAGQHWDEAKSLAYDLDLPVDKAVKALNALGGSRGSRAAN